MFLSYIIRVQNQFFSRSKNKILQYILLFKGEFNVWTREAGAGSLAISVEGPSKADIDFKDRKDGSCYVTYKVTEPGNFIVYLILLVIQVNIIYIFKD